MMAMRAKRLSEPMLQSEYANSLIPYMAYYGYPLLSPEPNSSLADCYQQDGFQIGDVGYVDSTGNFCVLDNVCFHPERIGIKCSSTAPEFRRIEVDEDSDILVTPNAISSDTVIKSAGIDHGEDSSVSRVFSPGATPAGAILILPSGARSETLRDPVKEKFREVAAQYGHKWCEMAMERTVFLITGFHKTRSWSRACFRDSLPTGSAIIATRQDKQLPTETYKWDTRNGVIFPMEPSRRSRPNQTIFLRGFRITKRDVQSCSSHFQFWSLVADRFCPHKTIEIPVDVRELEEQLRSDPASLLCRRLLEKIPAARIAITHDDEWTDGLQEGEKLCNDVAQIDVLIENLLENSEVTPVNDHGAICLKKTSGLPSEHGLLSTVKVIKTLRVDNISSNLKRMPFGFYIEIYNREWIRKTEVTRIYGSASIIEWIEEISLPMSSGKLQLSLFATFGSNPTLGGRQGLHTWEIDVRELAERTCHLLELPSQESGSLAPLLFLTTHQRHINYLKTRASHVIGSLSQNICPEVIKNTDLGHDALHRFYQDYEQEDIAESIERFQCALDMLLPREGSCYATAVFNLTTARLDKYLLDGTNSDLGPLIISRYQEVLEVLPSGHPDRPATLLQLARALLYRYGRQSFEELPELKIEELMKEVKEMCLPEGLERQNMVLVLQTYKRYDLARSSSSRDLNELLKEFDDAIRFCPQEHFDRPFKLINLGIALQMHFQDHNDLKDFSYINKAISLHEEALSVMPQRHPDRAASLIDLSLAFLARFGQCSNSDDLGDLNKAIKILTELEQLLSDGHVDRPACLNVLGVALLRRFEQHTDVTDFTDINNSIWRSDEATRIVRSDHPDRATYLDSLSIALLRRFHLCRDLTDIDRYIATLTEILSLDPENIEDILVKRSEGLAMAGSYERALSDADEVIQFDPSSYRGYERRHAALHGMRRYSEAVEAFGVMLSRINESPDEHVWTLCGKYFDVRPAIRHIVKEWIRHMPRILIDITTGRLKDKEQQADAFETLPIYHELVSSMITEQDHTRIWDVVKEFYRYVMLSHTWEPGEPLLQKVQHTPVYELDASPANIKLQKFCSHVRSLGFRWAWSDTCCIDKTNNVVLQESLIAMFMWYRGSSLTIVYLCDVPSQSQKPGDLRDSRWNTRGWTYQEYVSAETVQFYTEDWKPYLNLFLHNHKKSHHIITEMQQVSQISAEQLDILRPGLDRVREKLYMASKRHTTFVEDIAYSLLGIFNASIPVIYGEGNRAVGRLLEHILTRSGDVTLLAWTGRVGSYNSCLPVDLTVYDHIEPQHIPQPIDKTQAAPIVTKLRSSLRDLSLITVLYDRLNELPTPSVVASRLQLPGIMFQLTDLMDVSDTAPVTHVRTYRVMSSAFGEIIIKTADDLTGTKDLYLVHPWIQPLLDQEFSTEGVGELDKITRALRFVVRLRQPFGALLFEPLSRAEYRRVATDSLIMVRIREEVPLNELIDNIWTISVQ